MPVLWVELGGWGGPHTGDVPRLKSVPFRPYWPSLSRRESHFHVSLGFGHGSLHECQQCQGSKDQLVANGQLS